MTPFSRSYRALRRHVMARAAHQVAESTPLVLWLARSAELEHASVFADAWSTDAATSVGWDEASAPILHHHQRGAHSEGFVASRGPALIVVERMRRHISLRVSAATRAEAREAARWVRERWPEPVPAEKTCRVAVTFWSASAHGGGTQSKQIVDVSRWSEIGENYAAETRVRLDPLMAAIEPTDRGKLAVWLGPPGTGKTWALRALAWEHRESVSLQYILDPEAFFARVDYMFEVLNGGDDPDVACDDPDCDEDHGEASGKTRLVVLEDSGELLGVDAKQAVGQGLARLLNWTDGLPGQATKTRILVTTNEDVGRLHPAVTRAGRCASLLRFAPLPRDEAQRWLRDRGHPDAARHVKHPTSLADLFALARGEPAGTKSTARSPGFVIES